VPAKKCQDDTLFWIVSVDQKLQTISKPLKRRLGLEGALLHYREVYSIKQWLPASQP
jgi:hypothetical protein